MASKGPNPRLGGKSRTIVHDLVGQALSAVRRGIMNPDQPGYVESGEIVEHITELLVSIVCSEGRGEHESFTRIRAHEVLDEFLDTMVANRRSIDDGGASTLILTGGLYNSEAFGIEVETRDARGVE